MNQAIFTDIAEQDNGHGWLFLPLPDDADAMNAAIRKHDIDVSTSWVLGNTTKDVQTGIAVGCRTMLLASHAQCAKTVVPTMYAPSTKVAVDFIFANAEI